MRRILSVALLMFSLSSHGASVSVNGMVYDIVLGEASVASWQEVQGDVVIPESISYNGVSYPVTTVAERAFANCTGITSITIPPSVISIGYYAFNVCISLTRVNILDSENALTLMYGASGGQDRPLFADCPLESVYIGRPLSYVKVASAGYSPFNGQSRLTSVELGSTLINIDNYFLRGASALTSVTLPDGVYNIGKYAFAGCTSLEGFIIPDQVRTIGQGAFSGCSRLLTISIPASVGSIESNAFDGCNGIRSVTLTDGNSPIALSGKSSLFLDSPLEALYLGRTVNGSFSTDSVAPFYSQKKLASVMIGSGVKSLPDYCFSGCSALTALTVPANVVSIGNGAFDGCVNLAELNMSEGNETLSLGVGINDADTVGLFRDCNLSKLVLCRNLAVSGYSPFACIGSLNDVTIGANVTALPDFLFYGDYSLSGITLPDGLVAIGKECFAGTGMYTLTVPQSVKLFGQGSLMQFDEVTLLSTEPIEYAETQRWAVLFVPDDSYNEYYRSADWEIDSYKFVPESYREQKTVNITANPDGPAIRDVIGSENTSLYYNLKLTGSMNGYDIVTLRNKFTNLRHLDLSDVRIVANDGGHEYYSGYSLQIDDEMGDYCFYGFDLESLVLPSELVRIGKKALAGCERLTAVTNLKRIRLIDDYAFEGCVRLDNVVFGGYNVERIGKYAFSGCESLSSLKFETRTDAIIDSCAFIDCRKLENLSISGFGDIYVVGKCFLGCESLTYVDLGKGVKRIGDYTFYGCTGIENVVFGSDLQSIGNHAFSGCISLLAVMLPTSLQSIGERAFNNCSSMKEAKLPSSLLTVGDYAFAECPLTKVYTYTIEPTNINQSTFSCWRTATLYVPATSFDNYDTNTQWGQFLHITEFNEPYEYFYLNNDYFLNNGRIDGRPDLTMNSGSGFIVEGGDVQYISGLDYYHDGENGASIIAGDGNNTNLSVASMRVNLGVEADRWYFMCFPFEIETDSIECTSDYVFYFYNSGKRAKGNTGWTKFEGDRLESGKGYIFMVSRSGILSVNVSGENLKFNAANANVSVESYPSDNAENESWNFIGNPFICYYDIDSLANEQSGPIIIWDEKTKSYIAYKPGDGDDYILKPFEAVFVQRQSGSSSIEFLAESKQTLNQSNITSTLRARMRRALGYNIDAERLIVNITLMNNDSISDRARVVFNDRCTMGYDIGYDAPKFESESLLQIYTINGKSKFSINERPAGDDDIHIGYQVANEGTYVLDIARMDVDVAIYDNVERKYVDLSDGGYAFYTKAGTFNDRFVVNKLGNVTKVDGGIAAKGVTVKAVDNGIRIDTDTMRNFEIYYPTGILAAIQYGSGTVNLNSGIYLVKIGSGNIKVTVR